MFDDLPRLLRTVRHLRPSQVAWRLRYAAERRLPPLSRVDAMPAGATVDATVPDLPREPNPPNLLDDLEAGLIGHLNQRQRIGPPPVDWRLGDRRRDRLWTVTLHYHQWLHRLAVAAADHRGRAEALIDAYLGDWLDHCDLERPGARALVWNAYAIATRLGWWARTYRRLAPLRWGDRHPVLRDRFLASYWKQAAFLERHLEWDLRANHLLRDALGLLWAGRFFAHERATRWLQLGTHLVLEQAREQVMPDGVHFERSPLYHAVVLQDLATASALVRDEAAAAELGLTCRRMAEVSAWMRHPDGSIPLLNDASLDAHDPFPLLASFELDIDARRRDGGRFFRDGGWVVYHGPRWSMFFDIGDVGPDHQPGHAHADTLTICASVDGRRLLVDPGTHSYDDDETRRYDRSTRAHNTVCIDGEDSSEVWHIFRVGRRARVHDASVEIDDHGLIAAAWHDGYAWRDGRPIHARRVHVRDRELRIQDRVTGSGAHEIEGGFLLDPQWHADHRPGGWRLSQDGNTVDITVESTGDHTLTICAAPYHARYGQEIATKRLCWSVRGELPAVVSTRFEVL